MTNDPVGPGLSKLRDAIERGEHVDVVALIRDHPDETGVILDETPIPSERDWSRRRERMWYALAKVEREAGDDASLGALLREEREDRRLTVEALCAEIETRGARLRPPALERIESNRVTLTSVRPNVWAALTDYLEISRHQVVAALTMVLQDQQALREPPSVARARPAASADRPRELRRTANNYLDRVRREMGLPPETEGEPE